MAMYIDADALLLDEIERCGSIPLVGTGTSDNKYLTEVLRREYVDVEPVKHGHWITDSDDNWYECSSCKCLWMTISGTPQDNNMRFCPECGAHMDEEVKLDAAIH